MKCNCLRNVIAFLLRFGFRNSLAAKRPRKNVSALCVSANGCECLVGNNVVSLLLLAVWMGCVYEGEWCKSSSKFILPFSRLQWGVEIYGPYYSNYLQVMSSKSQLGMSLWLVKTSHLPLKHFHIEKPKSKSKTPSYPKKIVEIKPFDMQNCLQVITHQKVCSMSVSTAGHFLKCQICSLAMRMLLLQLPYQLASL